jgi:hypothetical protein
MIGSAFGFSSISVLERRGMFLGAFGLGGGPAAGQVNTIVVDCVLAGDRLAL